MHNLKDDEWKQTIDSSNVIVTTMSLAASISYKIRQYIRESVSFAFIDEAHHSKAETWNDFIGIFPPSKVIMFTATPFRNDGQKLAGKIIFNFSLKSSRTTLLRSNQQLPNNQIQYIRCR